MNRFVATILLGAAAVYGLRCYTAPQGYINNPVMNASLYDCIGVAYSCLKVMDYTAGTYYKGCNFQNCSEPGNPALTYAPERCYSSGAPRYVGDQTHNTTTCCCYGDGCNGTPQNLVGGLIAVVLFVVLI